MSFAKIKVFSLFVFLSLSGSVNQTKKTFGELMTDTEKARSQFQTYIDCLLQQGDEAHQKEISTQSSPDNLWLVFSPDRGNREDCSVYYCHVVEAPTGIEAIAKIANGNPNYHPGDLDCEPVRVVR